MSVVITGVPEYLVMQGVKAIARMATDCEALPIDDMPERELRLLAYDYRQTVKGIAAFLGSTSRQDVEKVIDGFLFLRMNEEEFKKRLARHDAQVSEWAATAEKLR